TYEPDGSTCSIEDCFSGAYETSKRLWNFFDIGQERGQGGLSISCDRTGFQRHIRVGSQWPEPPAFSRSAFAQNVSRPPGRRGSCLPAAQQPCLRIYGKWYGERRDSGVEAADCHAQPDIRGDRQALWPDRVPGGLRGRIVFVGEKFRPG